LWFIFFIDFTPLMTRPKATDHNPALNRDERLVLAVQEYVNNPKQSVLGLAKRHGVAQSTLQGRLKGAQTRADEMNNRRRLSKAETQEIAQHAIRMQDLHFPLTPADIKLEAERIWHAKDPDAKAKNSRLGKNWYREVFLKDNPGMRSKLAKGLDRNRATCASHRQLAAWHEDVRESDLTYSLRYLLIPPLSWVIRLICTKFHQSIRITATRRDI
jgi:hypothetical protein